MEDDSNSHVADDANFNACSILLKKGGGGGLTCLSELTNAHPQPPVFQQAQIIHLLLRQASFPIF